MGAAGVSRSDRRVFIETMNWLTKTGEALESLQELWKAGQGGVEYGVELQSRIRELPEHLALANRLFVESGIADAIGEELSKKAAGPFGALLFRAARPSIDAGTPALQSRHSQLEYLQARANLNVMRSQYRRATQEAAGLDADLAQSYQTAK